MEKILAKDNAEIAPPLKQHDECWYLPLFGVYHPKKPDQIWVVFDSSCQYNEVSLNDVLLKGPDLNNGLLGALLLFRKEDSIHYRCPTNVPLPPCQVRGQELSQVLLV